MDRMQLYLSELMSVKLPRAREVSVGENRREVGQSWGKEGCRSVKCSTLTHRLITIIAASALWRKDQELSLMDNAVPRPGGLLS